MTLPELKEISYAAEDGVATVSFDRPDRLNALSLPMVEELHTVFDHLERAGDVHVVVLTGTGRAFCAGIDLNDGLDVWPEPAEQAHGRYWTQQRYAGLVLRLRRIPQPVIAAVHGPACGGGFCLLAAADVRIADPSARANAAFVRVGLTGADMGLSWLLPRLVGVSAASELMYTGRFVGAEEGRELGLFSRLTEAGGDVEAAHALAREMLENNSFGLRMTKEAINHSLGAPSLEAVVELENRHQVLCSLTEGFNRAASEFIARSADRKPKKENEEA